MAAGERSQNNRTCLASSRVLHVTSQSSFFAVEVSQFTKYQVPCWSIPFPVHLHTNRATQGCYRVGSMAESFLWTFSRCFVFITLFIKCVDNFAQAGQYLVKNPQESIEKFEVVTPVQLSPGLRRRRSVTTKTQNGRHLERVSFSVFALGREFILDLTLNRVVIPLNSKSTSFSANGSMIVEPYQAEEHCYYHGVVRGSAGSSVAVSTCQGLEGLVFDGKESFYIEPANDQLSSMSTKKLQEDQHMFYRMSDLKTRPVKCGNDDIKPQHMLDDLHKMKMKSRTRRSLSSETKYVELVIVNDFSQYDFFKRDIKSTQSRARQIANLVDSLYRPLNIRVALVHLVTWNGGDAISVVENSETTLDNFMKWRNEDLTKKMKINNDNAHLLTQSKFEGATVGKAHVLAMCTSRSVGVVQDHSSNAAATAATFAHEMGHNLGMSHDESVEGCTCEDKDVNKGCIMSGVARSIPATKWSKCSEDSFKEFMERGLDPCLFNQPLMECKRYSDDCCNSTTCKLTAGSECMDGPCCFKCKLSPAGKECREKVSECDLPEVCDGKSELCPANRYVYNGKSCGDGKGFCFNGVCPTLDNQCETLWGLGVTSGPEVCYTINMKGTYSGSCAKLQNGSFVGCKYEDIYCGMLHCTDVKKHLPLIGTEREVYTYTWPMADGSSVKCKSAIIDVGTGIWNDGGMVRSGVRCGEDKVCHQQKCINVTDLLKTNPPCPRDCSSYGVCNNVGECFKYKGASTGQSSAGSKAGTVVLVLFILALVGLAIFAYFKRDLIKSKWNKYQQKRQQRYQSVQRDGARQPSSTQPAGQKRQISAPMASGGAQASKAPMRPAPGKIELPDWPRTDEDTPPPYSDVAMVPPVTRRPPPPRPMAPKDASLHRASSPPGFTHKGSEPPPKPAPPARPGSVANVLGERKPLPGRRPGVEWPPLAKSSSDGAAIDKKALGAPPPPPPPTKPATPRVPPNIPSRPPGARPTPPPPPPGKPTKPTKPSLPPVPPGIGKAN
ncbi:zinc metalloproteinase-disintegrin-like BjussuMP-1 isoform X2 [Nematostella vectensis]|uniref:zinc metalloproteinase-disintegrin-like BjussuMP-1 isoform X2 n=1 Tax=Nematostella vectensis TaxID=45351 RepID=UPI002076DA9A|nr:zinc metalloproteinase-disintegrin-like BjussuMP-1 isoform X2 [Nematostella vectensis]